MKHLLAQTVLHSSLPIAFWLAALLSDSPEAVLGCSIQAEPQTPLKLPLHYICFVGVMQTSAVHQYLVTGHDRQGETTLHPGLFTSHAWSNQVSTSVCPLQLLNLICMSCKLAVSLRELHFCLLTQLH